MSAFYNPVTGDKFFNREKEFKFLQKKVDDLKKGYRQNIVILGKALSGKTSLVLQFLSTMGHADTVVAYLDLSILSFSGFVDQFIGMLLYNYKGAEDNAECSLQSLIASISSSLPKTYQKIKNIYSYTKTGKERLAFDELFDLPPSFSKESGKFCIIVLDNFRKLVDYNLTDPFSVLGDKIMLQKSILYILSDYPDTNSRNIVSEKLSMLFGKFQVMELEPFNVRESMLFMDSRIKDVILSAAFKKFLAQVCAGEPFYLDIITEAIARKAVEKKLPIFTEEELYNIVYECVFEKASPINQYFSLIMEKYSGADNSREAIKILNAIVRKNKISDIAEDSKCQKKQVYKLLEKFIIQELVIKNGLLYTIEDEVFKLWLRLKEIEGSPRFKLDQGIYLEGCIKEIKRLFEEFTKEQQKPIDNTILNLITTFNNEKVTVGKATHILPAFKHVHTESVTEGAVTLSAHGTKLWIFSIFKHQVSEDDVCDYINYCKKQKHKVSRKILITLNDITPEAKLLAMEERVWIWPLDRLNSLLSLYKKPKVAAV